MSFEPWTISLIKVVLYIIAGNVIFSFSEKIIKKTIDKFVNKKYKEKEEAKARGETLKGVISNVIKTVLIIIIVLTCLPEFGIDIAPLLAGAGLVGLAVSFASRSIIEDYLSGFFLLMEDQFRLGDEIKIGPPINQEGKIIDFDLRKVIIQDKEGAIIIVRNSKISYLINKTKKTL